MNASYNKFGELSGLDSASPSARHKAPYTGIPEPLPHRCAKVQAVLPLDSDVTVQRLQCTVQCACEIAPRSINVPSVPTLSIQPKININATHMLTQWIDHTPAACCFTGHGHGTRYPLKCLTFIQYMPL